MSKKNKEVDGEDIGIKVLVDFNLEFLKEGKYAVIFMGGSKDKISSIILVSYNETDRDSRSKDWKTWYYIDAKHIPFAVECGSILMLSIKNNKREFLHSLGSHNPFFAPN
jgi:hypothetical protein